MAPKIKTIWDFNKPFWHKFDEHGKIDAKFIDLSKQMSAGYEIKKQPSAPLGYWYVLNNFNTTASIAEQLGTRIQSWSNELGVKTYENGNVWEIVHGSRINIEVRPNMLWEPQSDKQDMQLWYRLEIIGGFAHHLHKHFCTDLKIMFDEVVSMGLL